MGLKDRQLSGLMIMALMAMIVYGAVSTRFWKNNAEEEIPYGSIRSGPVVVELAGEVPQAGIYYLPEKTTLAEFIALTGVSSQMPAERESTFSLTSGNSVRIGPDGRVTLGKMRGTLRLALNLPLDINTATYEEMLMVPGIGEKTARQIMTLRNSQERGLRNLNELMKIRGIKEKRLEALRRYFYIEKG